MCGWGVVMDLFWSHTLVTTRGVRGGSRAYVLFAVEQHKRWQKSLLAPFLTSWKYTVPGHNLTFCHFAVLFFRGGSRLWVAKSPILHYLGKILTDSGPNPLLVQKGATLLTWLEFCPHEPTKKLALHCDFLPKWRLQDGLFLKKMIA